MALEPSPWKLRWNFRTMFNTFSLEYQVRIPTVKFRKIRPAYIRRVKSIFGPFKLCYLNYLERWWNGPWQDTSNYQLMCWYVLCKKIWTYPDYRSLYVAETGWFQVFFFFKIWRIRFQHKLWNHKKWVQEFELWWPLLNVQILETEKDCRRIRKRSFLWSIRLLPVWIWL